MRYMQPSAEDLAGPFIAAFNDIEAFLRAELAAEPGVPFSDLVAAYDEAHRLPYRHLAALRAFGSLRNAIAHGRYRHGHPIAQPYRETVEEIEQLREVLLTPPQALPLLSQERVHTVAPEDRMEAALALVREHDFSQLPVYAGAEYVALLTTNTIARWLADQFTRHGDLAEQESVAEVCKFAEPTDRAVHVPRDATVADVIENLSPGPAGQPAAVAVIFTRTGRPNQPPVGIAVGDDLPLMYAALGLG